MNIINTRADLNAIEGTDEHTAFIAKLKGSMTKTVNVAIYPDNYNDPEYDGEEITPIWEDQADHSVIESFGFTASEINAL